MKKTAFLVNTGRGALVEREALLDALATKKIAGAGLDVFHDEPLKPGDAILGFDTVELSPHNAGQTAEVVRDGLLRAVNNVENFLARKPTDVVVAPEKQPAWTASSSTSSPHPSSSVPRASRAPPQARPS